MKIPLILMVVAALAVSAFAQDTAVINVRDYGAMGDGSDQTVQINAALTASNALLRVYSHTTTGGAQDFGICPTVYFPAGSYSINGTLLLKNKYQSLKGDNAVIQPVYGFPAGSPAISLSAPLRNSISGFFFFGFSRAIVLGSSTYDSDQGMNEISHCVFIGMTDTAIQYGHRSSRLNVEGCRFESCAHVMTVWNCDLVEYHGCWVSQQGFTESNDSAFLFQGGTFHAVESNFIPYGITSESATECAWFNVNGGTANNVCTLVIERCRLSKENGGMTLVNWDVQGHTTYPVTPVGVILRDNLTEGGQGHVSTEKDCLVRLFACPNFICIRNNLGLTGACTMQWGSTANGSSLVFRDGGNSPLTVDVAENCGAGDTNLGLSLNYVLPEFSGNANLR